MHLCEGLELFEAQRRKSNPQDGLPGPDARIVTALDHSDNGAGSKLRPKQAAQEPKAEVA